MPSIPPTRQVECHCSSDSWTNRILVSLWGLGAINFALKMWDEDKAPEPIRYSLLSNPIHGSSRPSQVESVWRTNSTCDTDRPYSARLLNRQPARPTRP